jgi:hypothetical protein
MRINRLAMDRIWMGSVWRCRNHARILPGMIRIALILLDAIGRPVRRLDQNATLQSIADEALRLDCRWIALEQQRSGSPLPLPHDIVITRRIHRQLRLIDIRITDHVIAGDTDSFSFRANGLL